MGRVVQRCREREANTSQGGCDQKKSPKEPWIPHGATPHFLMETETGAQDCSPTWCQVQMAGNCGL